ncbi:MAG: sensor histidine kinase [Actinomycetota bacterium]
MSLRARLLLGMAVLAAVLALSAVAITRTTRDHLVEQVDTQLREASPQLRSLIGQQGPDGPGAPTDEPTPRLSNLYVGVITRLGELTTLHAPDLQGDAAPLPVVTAADVERLLAREAITVPSDESDSRYRLLLRDGPRGTTGVLGLSLDDVDSAVNRLIAVQGIALALVVAVLALVTWWVMRLGVRPVQQMTATAGAIAAGDLSQRVPEGTSGTEAAALGSALNAMLERIEDAFEQRAASDARLRQFVADASHELRTPVTTIRGYAELYRSGALTDSAELDEAMRRTEQEAVRMGGLVDALLRLARLDQGRPVARGPVDLALLGSDAVRDARATAPNRAVTLDAPEPVVLQGDEDGLRQVVANLVGNALVHAPDASVVVSVRCVGDSAVLEVADDGPGMSEADASHAFERFHRADASRSRHQGGAGLGLAIVEATVRAHGGRVSLVSTPGAGTTVRVELPIAAPVAAPVDAAANEPEQAPLSRP